MYHGIGKPRITELMTWRQKREKSLCELAFLGYLWYPVRFFRILYFIFIHCSYPECK